MTTKRAELRFAAFLGLREKKSLSPRSLRVLEGAHLQSRNCSIAKPGAGSYFPEFISKARHLRTAAHLLRVRDLVYARVRLVGCCTGPMIIL